MIQLALYSALSDRAAEGRVVVVDRWPFQAPSTRDAREALAALELEGAVLVVVEPHDLVAVKSFRNLPNVHLLPAGQLNAYDVLRSDWVVFTRSTLPGASAGEPPPTPSGSEEEPGTGEAT